MHCNCLCETRSRSFKTSRCEFTGAQSFILYRSLRLEYACTRKEGRGNGKETPSSALAIRGRVGTHIKGEKDRAQERGVYVILTSLMLSSLTPVCLQYASSMPFMSHQPGVMLFSALDWASGCNQIITLVRTFKPKVTLFSPSRCAMCVLGCAFWLARRP